MSTTTKTTKTTTKLNDRVVVEDVYIGSGCNHSAHALDCSFNEELIVYATQTQVFEYDLLTSKVVGRLSSERTFRAVAMKEERGGEERKDDDNKNNDNNSNSLLLGHEALVTCVKILNSTNNNSDNTTDMKKKKKVVVTADAHGKIIVWESPRTTPSRFR